MKNSAFTLIEILIVVVLLGVLAAIVIPQFTDASDNARNNTDDTNLDTLQTQVELYYAEEGSYPSSLDDLVTNGYMRELPAHSSGSDWGYVSGTGAVSEP